MTSDSSRVWLSVGSNHTDAAMLMDKALAALSDVVDSMEVCEPYRTPAINGVDADYLNSVATGLYAGTHESLVAQCKAIEHALGRSRTKAPCAPHTVEIDIDVVCFGGKILRPSDFSRTYFTRGYNQLINRDRYGVAECFRR
ncbi:MAG: 2-amino-4-hydroxy-6-hydroxymethyldihydropteridine diphosphokinase [Paramuribaculum sp.]|nr:2-amino-4-hydroxy-6-hydroxymethyldihydropteridine diphosphokinase [Paramuribaculum sp.]